MSTAPSRPFHPDVAPIWSVVTLKTREAKVELAFEDLQGGVRWIRLAGRMDVEGTRKIDLKFTNLAAAKQAFVIIDVALVDFLSSLGLGALVRSARAQMSLKGKVVLFSPQPHVAKVLETTQVDRSARGVNSLKIRVLEVCPFGLHGFFQSR